jgi:alpha-glucosidase
MRAQSLVLARLVLVLALVVGCGGTGGPTDGGARVDGARPVDSGRMDAGSSDGGRDAGPLRCGGGGDVPSWAREDGAAHRWRAECDTHAVSIWALADGVVRVRYLPRDGEPADRSFSLVTPANELAGAAVEAAGIDGGEGLALCTEALEVRVTRQCAVRVIDREGRVLLDDVEASPQRVVRSTPTDEPFFGLGEKTGALDRRGRSYVFYNTDAYDPALGGYRADQDPLYLSVPFLIGLRGGAAYGIFTDVAYRVEMDLARRDVDRYSIQTTGPILDQYVIHGPEIAEVVRRYTALTGRTPVPPRWALGYHQSRWGYWPESRIDELAAEFRARRIPADTLWLDIQHHRGFRTFTFDPAGFPDPENLAARLRARNFQLVVIADPGLKVDPGWPIYDRAMEDNLVFRWPDGRVYQGNAWPGASVFLDYTLPAARDFWAEEIGGLSRLGVSGIWLDVNEPTVMPESGGLAEFPDALPIHGDGLPSTMAEGHNVYALHQARATYEGLLAQAPDRRPFILSRAGFAGIQRWAGVWTGDAPSRWDSLRQTPAMLMSMGLSGVPFVGSDIGGYSGGASAELFARWMQVGAFSPFCRGHVTNGVNDQEPWAFGQEVEDISRHRLQERYRFLPYLYALFDEASRAGAPPLRPLVWHFQDQPELVRVDDQMMLGPSLMIAPVLEPGATRRTVRVPPGRWLELDSGAIYDGPATIEVDVTLAAVPTFVREGAVLPHVPHALHTGALRTDVLFLELVPGGAPRPFTLREDAGDGFGPSTRTTYTLEALGDGARLTIEREGDYSPPARSLVLRVRRVDGAVRGVRVDGRALSARSSAEELETSEGYFVDTRDRALLVRVPDPGEAVIELDYDPTITELRPDVEVVFEVRVPDGTPTSAPVHVVSSADGWTTHHPLAWVGPNLARGTVRVPRGGWFFYKYTRGGWETVETWSGCVEASNRYGFGAAHPVRSEQVATWRDRCP